MIARPQESLSRGSARPLMVGQVVAPLVLAAFGLAVVLLFALALSLVLDTTRYVPPAGALRSSFAARTDAKTPYAARPEMTIKPLRPSAPALATVETAATAVTSVTVATVPD